MSDPAPGVLDLLASGSGEIWEPAWLSLRCAAAAALLALPFGVPLGLLAGSGPSRWRRPVRAFVDAGLALPTTAIALVLYLLLSRRGWFGEAGLLFTPWAVILGQALVALPVVVMFTADAAASLDPRARWTALTLGATPLRRALWTCGEIRGSLLAGLLAAFGRAAGELGAALILGGNIRGETRTLTTAITLETAKGEFERAVALGIVLVAFAVAVIVSVRLLAPRRAGA
ncbi:MAG TPA: ABC transporter permease [Planctomycetota bacterium]|nr:ABC transporter permease [Planctomycetota bacterium]